ncbi:GNAT family N-acetyltransferase [Chromobacterium sphagni]|uniref:GNAT family N-acetyltransferase n=1 Tax=Chromobacterium sphagni TaxID=1903179 RepID=A0A1S1X032_9NEIS|nr:N-acetyltransferase [Chromobacterium sphagni]OHX12750.1 GNAT family N-acetyltransferase [Chromobacterium sphagni]OHX21107.1 GNAT family N-acetyltransferase [Chromobacterium sphagni]
MQLRQARQTDLAAVFTIEQAVFGSHVYPDFFFRQALDLWPDWFWLAEDESGAPIGYVLGAPSQQPDELWLLSLALLPACRGRGVGKALLQAALAAMRPRARGIQLTVDPANPAAALYQRLGFAVIGHDPGYFGPGEARWLMRWQPSASA